AAVTTATERYTEHTVEVAGLALRYLKGGAGRPVVVLHHSTGNPGWIPFYERLAERATIYVPDMPGYGQSARPEWAREPRDLAILLLQALPRLGLSRPALVGLGLGGFVAAEMGTVGPERIGRPGLRGGPGRPRAPAARGRGPGPDDGRLPRVRDGGLPRRGGVPRRLRRRRAAVVQGAVGLQPGDDGASHLEALHVQPPAGAAAPRGVHARA